MVIAETIAAKAAGAAAGAFLALAIIPPKTFSGFARRTSASLVAGPVFSPAVHSYMAWSNTFEFWMASTALTSFVSWWALGVGLSVGRKWMSIKAEERD